MGKLWLNNELVDRLAMLQQTEAMHPGINQVANAKNIRATKKSKGYGIISFSSTKKIDGNMTHLPSKQFNTYKEGLVDTAMAKGEGLFWVMPVSTSRFGDLEHGND